MEARPKNDEKIRLVIHVSPNETILKKDFAISKRLDELFADNRDEIKERIDEVISFIKNEGINLDYKKVAHSFKNSFYSFILVNSVKSALTTDASGIGTHLQKILANENCIADALYGKPLLMVVKQYVNNPDIVSAVEEELF